LFQLDLSGNRLSKGLDALKHCTNLKHLLISGNKFKELDALEPLKSLNHLTHLEIAYETLGLDSENVRQQIFEMLPCLQYLDDKDIDGNEEDEDEDNHNGTVTDDDVSDGDDELEDEEVEEEEEEEGDSEEDGDLRDLYNNGDLPDDGNDEDYNNPDISDEDDDEDDDDEEREPVRGKNAGQESIRGKKRKYEEGDPV